MLTAAKKEFIEFMMSADVLRFGDFTTKSGRKTPYFVNTGNYKTGLQNSRLGEFYAALVKDHGEGGNIVGYKPQDGDRVIIIEDVITAGTAIRETMPVLKGCADVKVTDMFISVNRCEVGQNPDKTAVMEVGEEFGIKVHALVTVQDIRIACSKSRHNCIRKQKERSRAFFLFVFFPLLCYIRTTKEAYLYDWFYHCKHCNGWHHKRHCGHHETVAADDWPP